MPSAARSALFVPRGFRFAAAAAGIKKGGVPGRRDDLGLVEAPAGATAAAVFTSNRVVAAPLAVGRENLSRSGGRVRAVIVNSGNANCATRTGRSACLRICRELSARLGISVRQVFPSSTGVIGVELPAAKILRALPKLLARRGDSPRAALRFAHAIMTTDTRPKLAAARLGQARLLGVAKGAGMIHPRLQVGRHATMLVYLFTDAAATPAQLRRVLRAACARTFNRISVDGDTSTNDTVLLLASGASGLRVRGRAAERRFAAAVEAVCASLAEQIVADGEGAQRVVRLRVEGAQSEAEAEQLARAVANSPLVKTAWAGADPNWGRILAAVGAAGVAVEPRRVGIHLGSQRVCQSGRAVEFDERRAHREMSRQRFTVRVRVGRGKVAVTFLGCDLTPAYARVNSHYRS